MATVFHTRERRTGTQYTPSINIQRLLKFCCHRCQSNWWHSR